MYARQFDELCAEASETRQESSWYWDHLLGRTLRLVTRWQETSTEERKHRIQEVTLIMQVRA